MNPDDPIVLGLMDLPPVDGVIDTLRGELANTQSTRRNRFGGKFFIAAISSIPWVGAYLSAMASFKIDESTARENELQNEWLEEHHKKLRLLKATLDEIEARFRELGTSIEERIESEEYLGLVRKAFRVWDAADTEDKRRYVANAVTNAGSTRLCSDDVIRLFLDWLALYHESHFAVIREIFQNPGSTRLEIWSAIYNLDVRDDSAEADLFKFLFRDLSTGGVIRQERDVNALGQFRRKNTVRVSKGMSSQTLKSPFDDKEGYVLTNMGRQFVHYTMNEVVIRLGDQAGEKEMPDFR